MASFQAQTFAKFALGYESSVMSFLVKSPKLKPLIRTLGLDHDHTAISNNHVPPSDSVIWLELIRRVVREELKAASECSRAQWLDTKQAANLLQICSTSLEKARSTGRGPLASIPYHKLGRSVRYARADIAAAVARLRVPGRAPQA